MGSLARAALAAAAVLLLASGPAVSDGAFAVGSTGDVVGKGMAFGWSSNYATKAEAVAAAMRLCGESRSGEAAAQCMVVATFRNECLAVAIDPGKGTPGAGWAIHPDQATAEQRALDSCKATAGPGRRGACVLQRTSCDTGGQASAPAVPAGPFMAFFDRGQDVVTPQAMAILRNVAESHKASGGQLQVMIAGHTARIGAEAANIGLSQRRANRVRDALVAFGVPSGLITTEAFGESRPLVETADAVAEPQNDRVEISFGPGAGW